MIRPALVCAALLLAGCAAPEPFDWPPAPGEPARPIVVSVDTWHSMIALPRGEGWEEWGYAERAWYLEGRQGFSGAMRALFGVMPSVIEVTRSKSTWAARTPQPPAREWKFDLTEAGYARLRDYLEAGRGALILRDGNTEWYEGAWAYSFLHDCHHWTGGALRAAGLPIAPSRCFTAGALESWLDEAAAAHKD